MRLWPRFRWHRNMLLIKVMVDTASVHKDIPQVVLKLDFFIVGDLSKLFFLQRDMEHLTELAEHVVGQVLFYVNIRCDQLIVDIIDFVHLLLINLSLLSSKLLVILCF